MLRLIHNFSVTYAPSLAHYEKQKEYSMKIFVNIKKLAKKIQLRRYPMI